MVPHDYKSDFPLIEKFSCEQTPNKVREKLSNFNFGLKYVMELLRRAENVTKVNSTPRASSPRRYAIPIMRAAFAAEQCAARRKCHSRDDGDFRKEKTEKRSRRSLEIMSPT